MYWTAPCPYSSVMALYLSHNRKYQVLPLHMAASHTMGTTQQTFCHVVSGTAGFLKTEGSGK